MSPDGQQPAGRRPLVQPDPDDEWEWTQVPRPSLRHRLTDAIVVIVGVLVLGVATLVGFGLLGQYLDDMEARSGTTAIDRVRIGECFDWDTPPTEDDVLPDVRIVDCAAPHDAELIHRFGWKPQDSGEAPPGYPGLDRLMEYAAPPCEAAFEAYVGAASWTTDLYVLPTLPLRSAWVSGGRNFECVVEAVDGAKLTGSVKDSQRQGANI